MSSDSGLSCDAIIQSLVDDDSKYETLDCSHMKNSGIKPVTFNSMMEALKKNSIVTSISMENVGLLDTEMTTMCEMLKENTTITKIDVGYNKFTALGMGVLGECLKTNDSVLEMKIHRQATDMGNKAEVELVQIWNTNITLQRLYCTLHDRNCNQINTKGEVRNKQIAVLKAKDADFLHLDPNRTEEYRAVRKKAQEEKERLKQEAKKPIDSKIESTGGPYTLKQLTCDEKFRPDDVPKGERHTFLSDEDFEALFKNSKDDFAKLPKWKQANLKKTHKLH